ncbi:MAG TPA: DUF6438 domain-containing protein [Mucilaginibacter sp.]|jgi:hypothetical protein
MKLYILFFFTFILLSRCDNHITRRNTITRIEVAKGGCLRGCPVTAISIDSSLTFGYFGGYKAKLKGNYTGKVTQGFWDSLNMKLEQMNYKHLDTTEYLELDGEQAEVICYWAGHKRRITLSIDGFDTTSYKSKFFRDLAYSYDHVKLNKTSSVVKFEVKYQYMTPPLPKKDNVKFPPPRRAER